MTVFAGSLHVIGGHTEASQPMTGLRYQLVSDIETFDINKTADGNINNSWRVSNTLMSPRSDLSYVKLSTIYCNV